jgi:hypothetical protein
MELYEICEKGELTTYNKVIYKKEEYDGEILEAIIKDASKYHIKEIYDYYYTDFNDKDEEYTTTYKDINSENIVVKDNAFYGVYLSAGSKYDMYEVIITLDNPKTTIGDGSSYSYTYWTWELMKKDS